MPSRHILGPASCYLFPRVHPLNGKLQEANIFKRFLSGRKNKLTSGPLWRTRHESNMHSTWRELFEKSSNMFSSVLASTARAFCEVSDLEKCFRPLSWLWRCLVKAFRLLWRLWRFGRRHEYMAVREIIANGLALCSTCVIFCVIMIPKCSGWMPTFSQVVCIDNWLQTLSYLSGCLWICVVAWP